MKSVMQFGKQGKLSLRYIRTFEVVKEVGLIAYNLALPPSISSINSMFHIYMLKKYHRDGDTLFVGTPNYLIKSFPMRRNQLPY